MTGNENLVLCGGTMARRSRDESELKLDLSGPNANVHLLIKGIPQTGGNVLPDALADLIEIACYVDAADSAIARSPGSEVARGRHWKRKLRFVIPVRELDFWSSEVTTSSLIHLVSFLSGDEYLFEFCARPDSSPGISYIVHSKVAEAKGQPNEIVLFSGGLDSLSGTVELLASHGRSPALVCLETDTKVRAAQRKLQEELQKRFGRNRLAPISCSAGLKSNEVVEHTHRTRSFLLAAIGAVVEHMLDLNSMYFFGNGVASTNLLMLEQVIGARAARTNHPETLSNLNDFLTRVLRRACVVTNPLVWCTKAEVVARMVQAGCADLIRETRSCNRVLASTHERPHCGLCLYWTCHGIAPVT